MKKITLMIFSALAICACNFSVNGTGVGNRKQIICKGPVTEQVMPLSGFDAIEVNGAANIKLFQGDECGVRVVANEEVFQYLDYHVDGARLILETVDHVIPQAKKFDVYITLPLLTAFEVSGAVDIELGSGYRADKPLKMIVDGAGDMEFIGVAVPSLSIELNGAGDIELEALETENLSIEVNGAGDVDVSGRATEASFSVNGAGVIDARQLECSNIRKQKSGIAAIRTK